MKSTEPTINTLFSSTKRYRVPLYQRHYVWEERNWEHLWADIEEKSNLRGKNSPKKHFTGAIVIQQDERNLEIIDGQQRLTTFQIILCAIQNICETFDDDASNIAKRSKGLIQNGKTSALVPDERYKLLPREGFDRNAFRPLIKLEEVDTEERDKSESIQEAYEHFRKKIKRHVNKDYDKLVILFECIINDFKVVQIEIDSEDDPAKIFQTINGTGRDLDEFDLLRNNLFLRARAGEKKDSFYTQYWQQFEVDLSFWRQPGVMDDFLEKFLRVKRGQDFEDQLNLFDQYQAYQENLADELNPNEKDLQLVEHEFRELKRYADIYQDIHDSSSDFNINPEIKSRVKFYEEFNIADTVELFILYITSELGLSGSKHAKVFDLFESYVVRRMLFTDSTDPLEEVKRVFLSVIGREPSFSLVDLIYRLSKKWPANQKIETNLNRLPQTKRNRKKSSSDYMRNGGKRIFDRVGWEISKSKLSECFCEIWPSAEAMLQAEFNGGLPIVYSRLPILAEAKPQLEPYKFITYSGLRELSKYEICTGKMIGIMPDTDGNETVRWNIKEILFAFPVSAMSDLESHINEICDDVKNAELKPVLKKELTSVQRHVKDWLGLYVDTTENPSFNQRLLPNIDVTAVTRAGHVLRGTLKSFNDDVIYMQINGQTVTVYIHGLYELNTAAVLQSKPRKFMTYDGLRELSKYEICTGGVIGTDPDSSSNERVVLNKEEILFDFPASAMLSLQPHLNNIRDDVKAQVLRPVSKEKAYQVNDSLLDYSVKGKGRGVKVVTRTGHVLQGRIDSFNEDAISMRIYGQKVVVYRHGLYGLNLTRGGYRHRKFMTYDGLRELISKRYTKRSRTVACRVAGKDTNSDSNKRVVLNKEEILFDFPVSATLSSQPHLNDIRADVKAQMLGPVSKEDAYQVEDSVLDSARQSRVDVKVVTRTGHVLQGRLNSFNEDAIDIQINGRMMVVVYRHGLYELNMAAMPQSKPRKFMTYNGLRELSKHEIRGNIVIGIMPDTDGNEKVRWDIEEILFDFSPTIGSDPEPYTICDDVLNQGTVRIQDKQLQLAMNNKVDVTVVTYNGHMLRGKIKYFNKSKIEMRVAGLTVNVYRHGLSRFSTGPVT